MQNFFLTVHKYFPKIPGKSSSRKFPGIISSSREFTVEKDSIQVENHCNSSKKCIFSQKRDVFDFLYSKFSVPGNSREFSGISREIDSPSQVTRPSNGQVFENRLISLG